MSELFRGAICGIGQYPDSCVGNSIGDAGKYFEIVPNFLLNLCGSRKMTAYLFGPFRLEVHERRLSRDGEPVALTPRVLDTLVYLVEHHGHLVEKDELLDAVWGNANVEEGSLSRTIHVIRKALRDGESGTQYIETVPTRGYRFIAPVTCPDGIGVASGVSALPELTSPKSQGNIRARASIGAGLALGSLLVLTVILLTGSIWRNSRYRFGKLVPPTDNGTAYSKYQTGRLYLERQHRGDYETALENFKEAIALDPRYSTAYAGIADSEIFLFWNTGSHDDIAQARLAVTKALELDQNSSYAHALLCRIRATYDWDFKGAETECRRAVALDPGNHEAHRELAFLLNSTGKRENALQEMNIAVALAPTSFNKRSRGLLLYFARRFDEAIAQLKQVERTDREYSESNRWIARSFEQKRDYSQALEFLIKDREQKEGPKETDRLRRAFATGGWPEVLRTSLADGEAKSTLETAGTLAQLGENDRAFEVLSKMVNERRVMIVHLDSEPRLDPIRQDPRFEEMANRVGLRGEAAQLSLRRHH
jgi:DNA-binding winged helix-turn-helix (wHTH) protein/tetratricopeptide (TPR) repeat protein